MTRLPAALLITCALATAVPASATEPNRDTYCVTVGPFTFCSPPLPLGTPR